MYGSSDSQRFFTSTSPSRGTGTGASISLKLSSRTASVGKLASAHALFSVISGRNPIQRGEARQVMLGVAELLRDHRQAPERVRHLQFFRHAHAAVQLHRLLADQPAVVRDLD